MTSHTNFKQHNCETYVKLFSQKLSLRKHLLIHTGDKQHSFETCGKLYRDKSFKYSFKNHMHIHTGEHTNNCGLVEYFLQKRTILQSICFSTVEIGLTAVELAENHLL